MCALLLWIGQLQYSYGLLEFFTLFNNHHPIAEIGLTKFSSLQPSFIKRLKEWNTCCCRYHTKLNKLRLGLQNIQSQERGVHVECNCACHLVCRPTSCEGGANFQCCAHTTTFPTLTTLWSSILCPLPKLVLFCKRACIMGDCEECGIQNLNIFVDKYKMD
jgi:hypothetical protein